MTNTMTAEERGRSELATALLDTAETDTPEMAWARAAGALSAKLGIEQHRNAELAAQVAELEAANADLHEGLRLARMNVRREYVSKVFPTNKNQ